MVQCQPENQCETLVGTEGQDTRLGGDSLEQIDCWESDSAAVGSTSSAAAAVAAAAAAAAPETAAGLECNNPLL